MEDYLSNKFVCELKYRVDYLCMKLGHEEEASLRTDIRKAKAKLLPSDELASLKDAFIQLIGICQSYSPNNTNLYVSSRVRSRPMEPRPRTTEQPITGLHIKGLTQRILYPIDNPSVVIQIGEIVLDSIEHYSGKVDERNQKE